MTGLHVSAPSDSFVAQDALVGSRQAGGQEKPIYRAQWETHRLDDPDFVREWEGLLARSGSPQPIYQSPAFVRFVRSTGDDPREIELLTLRDAACGALRALTPIRHHAMSLGLHVSHRRFELGTLAVGAVMGSSVLGDDSGHALATLAEFAFRQRPRMAALSFQAVAKDGRTWGALQSPGQAPTRYGRSLLNGWRECHRIPLDGDFAAYLAQFGSKHRYNLKRQVRLLREHAPLEWLCIEQAPAVPALIEAIDALAPPHVSAGLISGEKFEALARHDLLRCYVLRSAGRPAAALVATQFDGTLYLHNVLTDPAMQRLSVGTVALYLAIEDLCTTGRFRAIDLGYSTPSHSHQSTNRVELRGHCLLYRPSLRTWLLCRSQCGFDAMLAWMKHSRDRLRKPRGGSAAATRPLA